MAHCPKCRGLMTPGYTFTSDSGARVKWVDGEMPSLWKSLAAALGIGLKVSELASRRCSECGFVEFFADPAAKPVKTLATVDEETAQLRSLMSKMQDRLAVLETIATDPAERTAREIESLRDLPAAKEDPTRL
jgi:hypothetical protein